MAPPTQFPLGSGEWYDAWYAEESARYKDELAGAKLARVEYGMPEPHLAVTSAHEMRIRQARGFCDAYRLIHHESRPHRPSWWERKVYGRRPLSSRRILTHALVLGVPALLVLIVVAVRASFPIAIVAASAVAAVTALALCKGNV